MLIHLPPSHPFPNYILYTVIHSNSASQSLSPVAGLAHNLKVPDHLKDIADWTRRIKILES